MKAKQMRLLRTSSNEVSSLQDAEAKELLSLLLQGLADYAHTTKGEEPWTGTKIVLATVLRGIEESNLEDAFGTEGWQRGIFGVDV